MTQPMTRSVSQLRISVFGSRIFHRISLPYRHLDIVVKYRQALSMGILSPYLLHNLVVHPPDHLPPASFRVWCQQHGHYLEPHLWAQSPIKLNLCQLKSRIKMMVTIKMAISKGQKMAWNLVRLPNGGSVESVAKMLRHLCLNLLDHQIILRL